MPISNIERELSDDELDAIRWKEVLSDEYVCPYPDCEDPLRGYIYKVDQPTLYKVYDRAGNLKEEYEPQPDEWNVFEIECRECGREVNVVYELGFTERLYNET
jgi:hypothetical protein